MSSKKVKKADEKITIYTIASGGFSRMEDGKRVLYKKGDKLPCGGDFPTAPKDLIGTALLDDASETPLKPAHGQVTPKQAPTSYQAEKADDGDAGEPDGQSDTADVPESTMQSKSDRLKKDKKPSRQTTKA